MANLHGHGAGNGGHSQGEPTDTAPVLDPTDRAGVGDGLMANLHGHAAGNGGHSQGEPTGTALALDPTVNSRRAPDGVRLDIRRISPPCLPAVQTSLKAVRCHRITVAGWTTETTSVQPLHKRDSRTQNRRSERRRRGRGAVRWRTASWCRNARFSHTRERWLRTPRRRPIRMRVIMPAIIDQAGRKSTLTRRTE